MTLKSTDRPGELVTTGVPRDRGGPLAATQPGEPDGSGELVASGAARDRAGSLAATQPGEPDGSDELVASGAARDRAGPLAAADDGVRLAVAVAPPAAPPGGPDRIGELFARSQGDRDATVARMRLLLAGLGEPQSRFPAIHVTGTNGKTTVARMIEALLREHAVHTGAFISPHLQDVRERVLVDGDPISETDLFAGLSHVDMTGAAAGPDHPAPSFFETMTALAFSHFAREKVEIAVVEAGRGGLRDATNVLAADIAVLGPIALDHPDLGATTAEIAADKAGIIAPGATVVIAPQEPAAAAVIDAALAERGARPLRLGTDMAVTDWQPTTTGQWFRAVLPGGVTIPVDLPLVGRHHADNAVLALAATQALLSRRGPDAAVAPSNEARSHRLDPTAASSAAEADLEDGRDSAAPGGLGASAADTAWDPAAPRGLDADTAWACLSRFTAPGRCEIVRRRGKAAVWLDGAHNPAAARALARTLSDIPGTARVILVAGIMSDKDADGVLSALAPVVHRAVLAPPPSARGGDPARHRDLLAAQGIHPYLATGAAEALEMADQLARTRDIVLVTGSLYTVGAVRDCLGLSIQ